MEIINKKIEEVFLYANNPRKNDMAVDKIAASIKEFGFKVPIIIDKDNVIVAGNTRYKASRQLGLKEIPCIIADDLTEQQIKAFRIADNKTSEFAEWDMELLEIELEGLDDIFTGFDDAEFDDIMGIDKEVEEDDFEIELPDEPKAKLGEIYQLGRHRLMCGSSTEEEDVNKLMDGKKADMCFTDPPYNVSIGTIKHSKFKQREIMNDQMSTDDFKVFCKSFVENIKNYTNGCVYMCSGQGADGRVMFTIADEMMHCSTTIIWVKDQFTLGRGKYHNRFEPIWFGWAEDGASFTEDRTLDNVWEIDRPQKSELHPTMKPLKIMETAMLHNPKAKSVLDLFGGSGSTLIACEQLDRICYMMELDPKYVDVIISRWEEYTGEKAVLLI